MVIYKNAFLRLILASWTLAASFQLVTTSSRKVAALSTTSVCNSSSVARWLSSLGVIRTPLSELLSMLPCLSRFAMAAPQSSGTAEAIAVLTAAEVISNHFYNISHGEICPTFPSQRKG